ncbi:putative glycoprotein [uncultured Mediterranean phage uvMED]|nr:putative glycoprotein [uncultured Mediterranean phage uvMED]
MAGKLVQVATETVTSAVASVTLTGIDSSDVYMVSINNLFTDSGTALIGRFTESGTENSTSNYDMASKRLQTNTTFNNMALQNRTDFYSEYFLGSILNTTAPMNAIFYIYNANNSSEYTFISWEQSGVYSGGGILLGNQGGGVFTVQSQVDGFKWATNTGNIAGGTFTLYRCV